MDFERRKDERHFYFLELDEDSSNVRLSTKVLHIATLFALLLG